LIEYLVAGGPVMIPIGLCSIVALAMFLERMWALRRGGIVPGPFIVKVESLVEQGRYDEAIAMCRGGGSTVGRVLDVAISSRNRPRSELKERLEEVGRREAAEMERGIPVVGTIASISPLLGLLGTVGGMILTFQMIQDEGMGNVGSLAGGISQALVTTFAGLSVGIPAVIANRYLLAKVDGLLMELEEVSIRVIDMLVDEQQHIDEPAEEAAK